MPHPSYYEEGGARVGISRGGHSHMRNTYGCDREHGEVTRPRRFFLVGHRVTKVFQAAQNKVAFHALRVILWRAGLYILISCGRNCMLRATRYPAFRRVGSGKVTIYVLGKFRALWGEP